MSNDNKFIDGLSVKAPHERAPEYVKAKLSIKVETLIAWLSQQTGEWVNADVKVSQQGNWYVAVDDWKPEGKQPRPARVNNQGSPRDELGRDQTPDFDDSDIPF